jgi:hypothetical protein
VVDEVAGFNFKIRVTANATSSANILTEVYCLTSSNSTAQQVQYPLDQITLSLTGLVSGSDIVVLAAGTETERVNVDAWGSTSYDYVYTAAEDVDICVYKQGYIPFAIRDYTLPAAGGSLPIAQVADRNFSA